MIRLPALFAALALGLAAGPALSQSLEDYEAAEAELVAVWEATPLTFRNVTFVTEPSNAFGVYKAREGDSFKTGEPIIVYAEPIGFGWKETEEAYEFGFKIDLNLKDAAGEVIAEQTDFQTLSFASQALNREFNLSLTLNLTGLPAGEYVLEYVAKDIAEEQEATISLPFTITE